jgi:hypothetical protein
MRRDPRSLVRPRASSAGVGTRHTQAPFAPDRVVANEYAAVSAKSTPSTSNNPNYPPTRKPPAWPGYAAKPTPACSATASAPRPVVIDCRMESACETCTYFRTSVQFLPTLTRQRDDAQQHGQVDRAALFESLIQRVDPDSERS